MIVEFEDLRAGIVGVEDWGVRYAPGWVGRTRKSGRGRDVQQRGGVNLNLVSIRVEGS